MEELLWEEKFTYEESKLFGISKKDLVRWDEFTLREKAMFRLSSVIKKAVKKPGIAVNAELFDVDDEDIMI